MKNILILVLLSFGMNAAAQVFLEQVPHNDLEDKGPFTVSYELKNDSAFRVIINEYSVKKIPDGKIYQESGREQFLFKVRPGTLISLQDIQKIDEHGSVMVHAKDSVIRYGRWSIFLKRQLLHVEETLTQSGTALEPGRNVVSAKIDTAFLGSEVVNVLMTLVIIYGFLFLMIQKRPWIVKLIASFVITGILLLIPQDSLYEMAFFDVCLMSMIAIVIMLVGTLAKVIHDHIAEQIIPKEPVTEN